ncbi:Trichome differentiation protein GL1 [Platanthera guangdongensis]|uniref:Trichome differentiation protein GL1 n=1 Tax=Platanthera guangdongensis TaxID=2320717 RepID=A0ABR2MCW0_9ASPA
MSAACPALPALRTKSPWTAEEDEILLAYITKHGANKWDEVARKSGLRRGGKSCRLRWKNQLHPRLKKDPFTVEEKDYIVQLHKHYGSKWSLIAAHFPGRTDNAIKNICNSLNKSKQRAAGKIVHPAAPPSPQLLLPPPPPPETCGAMAWRELPSIQHMSPKRTTNNDMFISPSSPLLEDEDVEFWINSLMQDDQVPPMEDLLSETLRQPVDSTTSAAGGAQLYDVDYWNSLIQELMDDGPEPLGQFADSDIVAADVHEMISGEVVASPFMAALSDQLFPYDDMNYAVMPQNSITNWPAGYGFDDGELEQNFFPLSPSSTVDLDHRVEMTCDSFWGGLDF